MSEGDIIYFIKKLEEEMKRSFRKIERELDDIKRKLKAIS